MKYRFLTLKRDCKDYRYKRFSPLYILDESSIKVDINDYICVYEGEYNRSKKNIIGILENLYEIFNINRPSDYHGASMSVSDIIVLDDEYYYCDSFGFKKLDFPDASY